MLNDDSEQKSEHCTVLCLFVILPVRWCSQWRLLMTGCTRPASARPISGLEWRVELTPLGEENGKQGSLHTTLSSNYIIHITQILQ